ncbi:hypothetical protein EJ08DRAFT_661484 [Tothia fuscella]|uniref:Uncharacterized protein n=1 Tax=Tothia fuscella TaxID=1048955 RepID=A0A9P4NQW9_9PEZI|nr:hypothetical protein EJ08DRAFT_661484 [Tothia fuscella]
MPDEPRLVTIHDLKDFRAEMLANVALLDPDFNAIIDSYKARSKNYCRICHDLAAAAKVCIDTTRKGATTLEEKALRDFDEFYEKGMQEIDALGMKLMLGQMTVDDKADGSEKDKRESTEEWEALYQAKKKEILEAEEKEEAEETRVEGEMKEVEEVEEKNEVTFLTTAGKDKANRNPHTYCDECIYTYHHSFASRSKLFANPSKGLTQQSRQDLGRNQEHPQAQRSGKE